MEAIIIQDIRQRARVKLLADSVPKGTVVVFQEKGEVRTKACLFCGRAFTKDPRYSTAYWSKQLFCSQTCSSRCSAERRANDKHLVKKRFDQCCDRRGENDCWPWTGAKSTAGRGVISVNGKTVYAPRLSLELSGKMPGRGQMACHTCDNPNCVNPKHLYWGDAKSNAIDAVSRNRLGWVKLTPDDVRSIRLDKRPTAEIAMDYGVSSAAIRKVIQRKSWRHVE